LICQVYIEEQKEKIMKIQSRLRENALAIFKAGLQAADPLEAIHRHVKRIGLKLQVGERVYNLSDYERIYVIGGGKAGAPMARAIEDLLKGRITAGLINVKYGHLAELEVIRLNEAGHPIPDEAGVRGAQEIVELARQAGEKDLVICLISGGGSALLPLPIPGITLEEKQMVTQLLLACGATINEINTLRKHISQIKGGQLARIAMPATLISLILSDVIGDPLDVIASGPTVPDESTFQDCWRILEKYQLVDRIPRSVLNHIRAGLSGQVAETPKPGDPAFSKTQNLIVGSNLLAVKAAAQKAKELGYNTLILSSFVEGETREVAKVHAAIVKEILNSGNPIPPPACIISGGETTVTLKGKGLGGRNQEFVLAAAIDIAGLKDVVILSAGTDGTDGPTDAAGAIADGSTVQRAKDLNLDPFKYLQENDSYHFFQPLEDLILTGPTNTNVMDLRIMLVGT
jgi:hydroxypyruvate reductase